ncbi:MULTISPECIES: hypothetical protein [Gluconobacter]|uniref:DUF4134 domain-containing protein n=1 Tax=Gluconobacter japonicus TaxID=376620 RepID=A0A9Q2FN74_GLUJA|nr:MULTISPECIES: hypothetical protein [Gluconobacter]MBF0871585.1 hypothetical protein [Gluconobacter japonicus]MBS1028640.1 hypothetical protein [Gluconobacter albidus]MBS1031726.1 hypothetical protein [Gluconobacter cerinus]MBS1044330.1 hypothetical protein [Gluconobacter cerinus]MBS1054910.1 hypothetical protein [Gluconobacter kondonii]
MTDISRRYPKPTLMVAALGVSAISTVLLAPAAHAQAVDDIMRDSTQKIMTGFGTGLNAFCYIVGGAFLAMAIFGWWQHQRNPNAGSKPGMIIAGFICGGILLAFPFLAKTASFTVFGTAPSVTGEQQQMKFDK